MSEIDERVVWYDVGAPEDFSEDRGVAVAAGRREVVVFRIGDDLFALRDRCSHGRSKLSEGWVEDGGVECPLHQGRFDIRTGAHLCPPLVAPVPAYAVRVVDGRVQVAV